jgi:hypothetical protein
MGAAFHGRDGVRSLLGYGAAVGSRLTVSGSRVSLDTVHCLVDETNDWLKPLGIRALHYNARFIVERGRIRYFALTPIQSSREELAGQMAVFLLWLAGAHPDDADRLLPRGRPVFDADSGRRLVVLAREWRAQVR